MTGAVKLTLKCQNQLVLQDGDAGKCALNDVLVIDIVCDNNTAKRNYTRFKKELVADKIGLPTDISLHFP